jgi:hypothetical protein
VITIHSKQGQQQEHATATPIRTFCSREAGKRAFLTLHENSEVNGFVECEGHLFDFLPRHERRLVQTGENQSSQVKSTHYFRSNLRGSLAARALADDDDGDYEIPEIATEGDWYTPPAAFENVAALEEWGGVPWFPGCYSGDSKPHLLKIGIEADAPAAAKHGNQLNALIETIIGRTSFVYENQFNIRIQIGSLNIYTSTDVAPDYARDCPDINTKLTQLRRAAGNRDVPLQGVTHVLTGCGNGYGVVGVAYVRSLCSTRGYNTGVNQLHNSMSWVTFAHELGHNFGGQHSFEEGQGSTGGIMDYGDGKLQGEYQFNTQYRKGQMCQVMANSVGRCSGNFEPLEIEPTASPTTATLSPATQPTSFPTNAIFTTFGSGFCRGQSASDNPSTWYIRVSGFSGNLEDCEALCSANVDCKAIEFRLDSQFHCELWTREPQAISPNELAVCRKVQVPTPLPTPLPTPPPSLVAVPTEPPTEPPTLSPTVAIPSTCSYSI